VSRRRGSQAGRLVVGVDGEGASRAAVDWTAHRVGITGERVVVLAATTAAIPPPHLLEALEAAHVQIGRAAGDDAVEQRMVCEAPSITEALIDEADGDPLVIGHHRSHPLRSALSGWLPLDIVTQAEGPVFVIPDDVRTRGDQIVVGVDLDGSARGAIAFALEEAERTRCRVRLVLAETRATAAGALTVDQILADLRDGLTVPLTSTVAQGAPGKVLSRQAERSCLIVVGRHAGTPIEEVLMGATDHHLMKSSRVPLCVVPPPERSSS
jgi:nucleotide-binding universal stress UspA family protein